MSQYVADEKALPQPQSHNWCWFNVDILSEIYQMSGSEMQ